MPTEAEIAEYWKRRERDREEFEAFRAHLRDVDEREQRRHAERMAKIAADKERDERRFEELRAISADAGKRAAEASSVVAEASRAAAEANKQFGKLSSKWGRFVEEMVSRPPRRSSSTVALMCMRFFRGCGRSASAGPWRSTSSSRTTRKVS